MSETEAFDLEVDLIAWLKASGRKLVNLTSGGEGSSGRVLSSQSLAKMSLAKKGKRQSESLRVARAEAMRRNDVRHKLRLAQSGRATKAQLIASKARPLICIETGEVHPSSGAAARWLRSSGYPKANGAHVWSCGKGDRRMAYGYTWRFQ
jgi:hypothetical protein